MRPVSYMRAADVREAVAAVAADPRATFLAGGTTEVDLVRLGVSHPDLLVDVNDLPLADLEELPGGGLRIGALARMSDVARAPAVLARYPGMSQALLLGASEQLRNMATMGGNLCQRTRCNYFRDGESPCNKREPGTGCSALEGDHRGHAVLGASDRCIATHPSDVAVALIALDAVVRTVGPHGTRSIPIDDFYLLPEQTPDRENPLEHGEMITAIEVPPFDAPSHYVKYRDRESYEFALVSVFSAARMEDDTIRDIRLALGGVATKPWRCRRAEARLIGGPATVDAFVSAAEEELRPATPRPLNAFKVEFAKRALLRALGEASS